MTSSTSETTGAAAPPASGGRIALWDNARLVLILLVVFGHCIEGIHGVQLVTIVYDVVFAFHMPAFLLVSGWFARADRLDRRALVGTARLVVTWLIVEVAWIGVRFVLGEPPVHDDWLVVPSWTLWFLVSLFTMRLLLPYLALLRAPMVVALAVALAAGLTASVGTPFSASRTAALLPFFVLGWWLRRARVGEAGWFVAPSARVRAGAGVVFVLGIVAVLLLMRAPGFTNQLLFWRRGYDAMDLEPLPGMLLRSAFLAVGVAMTLAVLLLVPRSESRLSVIGRNTLPVYLLHAPLVDTMRQTHLDDAIGTLPVALLVMLAIAVVITAVTGSPPVARLMRPVTEPDAVFRRSATT